MRRILMALVATSAFGPALALASSNICVSASRGHIFRAEDGAEAFAKQKALAACQADSGTSNAECESSVVCDHGRKEPTVCEAVSNDRNFRVEDTAEAFARQSAISKCQGDTGTSNAECVAKVACSSASAREVTCRTISHGQIFTTQNTIVAIGRVSASNACKASSSTSNQECESNVLCDNESGIQSGVCQTTSGGQVFASAALPLPIAKLKAVGDCQASPSTQNAQCASAVACVAAPARQTPTSTPSGTACLIRESQSVVPVDRFYSVASDSARASGRCVIAKKANVPSTGRLYRADGSRVDHGDGMSNKEIDEVTNAAGLSNCARLTCELQ